MSAEASESLDLSGRTILDGRYELLERLGAGAFGSVYRARELALGQTLREVAIKLTHARRLTPRDANQLLEEGRVMARLVADCRRSEARRHLVQVYGLHLCAELDHAGCLVLELVRGVRLLDHIRTFVDGLPLAMTRRYLMELCTAVAACHELDPPLVHGDLKPDNVLVDETGTLRIADFGLARRVQQRLGFAAATSGALAYVAPEVLTGRLVPQSDLYSVGLILCEMLTGDGPHCHLHEVVGDTRARAFDYLKQKAAMRFPPPESDSEHEAALAEVVAQCCAFDARQRPGSVQTLLERLHAMSAPTAARTRPDDSDWQRQLAGLVDGGQFAAGHALLTTVAQRDEPAWTAWDLVCRAGLGEPASVMDRGGPWFEARGAGLEPGLLRRVLQVLAASARSLGNEHGAQYYQDRLGPGGGR